MDTETEGSVNGSVPGIETKEIRVFLKTESNVVELSLCEHRHVSRDVVPDADESVETEFCARLGAFTLSNRRIVDSSHEYTGSDTDVRL